MRNRHQKQSNNMEVVYIDNDEEIPKGYIAVAGCDFGNYGLRACISEAWLCQPELVNQIGEQAQRKIIEFFQNLGAL